MSTWGIIMILFLHLYIFEISRNFLEHREQMKTGYKESCHINMDKHKKKKVAEGYVLNDTIYIKCQPAKQYNANNKIQTFNFSIKLGRQTWE